jgi:P-type E1-E2 ATPase
MRHAASKGISPAAPEDFEYVPGRGVRCRAQGREIRVGSREWVGASDSSSARTEVCVSVDGQVLGALHVEDEVRSDTVSAVAALRDLGLRVVLLTGDTPESAQLLGDRLALDDAHGGMLPELKMAHIDRLLGEGRVVGMVGDGVNDAPALARASVGIAMGTGTDVATETAGVVLLGGRITALVEAVGIGRRCRRVIRQNFVGTIVVDGIGMALAGCGVLPPVLAGIVHVASELAFILNSTRMLPRRRKGADPLSRSGR